MKDGALGERCRRLRLILSDVDGVMTNGIILLLPDGRELQSFHIRDGLAVVLAHRAGLKTGLLSGRAGEVVGQRAKALQMAVVRLGVSDKGAAFDEILREQGLLADEVAYIGDDLNDLVVLRQVGLSAAPADAPLDVRGEVYMVMEARGGQGCLREFVEAILKARGDWEGALESLGAGGH
jgi:3-deoxy-D-manno-octulosonate 8-phosphate phosphatase (KDO 8-P phosphatase)